MNQVIRKLLLFVVLLSSLVVGAYFSSGYLSRNHRLGTTALKQSRLQQLGSPKVVLVGGSNLHYGINSAVLEKQLGIPVVNMGIQGDVGLPYYFAEIQPFLGKGDLVFFLGEHYQYNFESALSGGQALYNLLSKYPKGVNYLDAQHLMRMPGFMGSSIKENLEYSALLLLSRQMGKATILEETNQYGDYLGHAGEPSAFVNPFAENKPQDLIFPPTNVAFFRQAQTQIEELGAELFFGFSPIAAGVVNQSTVNSLDSIIELNFGDYKLGDGSSYILTDSFFLDTHYHLIYDKRDLRTDLLLQGIRANRILAGKFNTVDERPKE